MRIISQDGTIDTPYDLSMIWIMEKYGYSVMAGMPNDEPISLGKYSSREKALKAMEMLRERHTDNIFCREDIQYKAEMLPDDGLQIVREMMMKFEYFQFPQDDEIEV